MIYMKTLFKNFLPFVSYWAFAGIFLLLPALVFSFVSNTTIETDKSILSFSYIISCLVFIVCNILIGLKCKLKEFLTGFILLEIQLGVFAVLIFTSDFYQTFAPFNIIFGNAKYLFLNEIFALVFSLLLPLSVFIGYCLQKKNIFVGKSKTNSNAKTLSKTILKNTFSILTYWILVFFFVFSIPVFSVFVPENINTHLNIILLCVFIILFVLFTFVIGFKQKLSEFIGGFVLLELQLLVFGILIFAKEYNNLIYFNIPYCCFEMMHINGVLSLILSLLLPTVSTFSGYFVQKKANDDSK